MKKRIPYLSFTACLIIVCVGHFIVDFMIGIWPIYKMMMGFDLAKAGIMVGVAAALGEGIQFVSGPGTDKGFGKALAIGGIILATSAVFLAFTHNPTAWLCLIVLTYLGSGFFHPAAGGLLGMLPTKRLSLLMGLFAASGTFGMSLSQLVFSKAYSISLVMVLVLTIPTAVLALWGFFQRSYMVVVGDETESNSQTKKFDFQAFGRLVRDHRFLLLYVALLTTQIIFWSVIFLLPDLLQSRRYPSWLCLGSGHLVFMLGSSVITIVAGWLADRFSSTKVMIAAFSLGLPCCYIIAYMPNLSVGLMLLCLFFLGGACYSITPVGIAFGNRLMPGSPGLVNACLMGMVWAVSESVSPLGSGLLASLFHANAPGKALGIMGALLFVGLWCSLLLEAKTRRPVMAEA